MQVITVRIVNPSEFSLLAPCVRRHRGGAKATGFSHHVGLSGLLYGVDELLALLESDGRRHGRDDMTPRLHHIDAMGNMVGGTREDGYRVHLGVLQHRVELLVGIRAVEAFHQPFPAVFPKVGHGRHLTIRVHVPGETGSKPSADDPDAQPPGGVEGFVLLGGTRAQQGSRGPGRQRDSAGRQKLSSGNRAWLLPALVRHGSFLLVISPCSPRASGS